MTRSEILERIRPIVADSLAVPLEDVSEQSRLIDELGADSLDFIDIVFSLERTFGLRIREGELDFLSRLDFSSPAVLRDGFLTVETVEKLKTSLPALAGEPDTARITPGRLFSLITIETLCLMVERRLAQA